jgi:hypothetical protein
MLPSYLAHTQGATTLAYIKRASLQTHEILNELKKFFLGPLENKDIH